MAAAKSRYARALADVVFDRKLVPGRVREQLQSLVETVAGSKDLRQVWENPSVPHEEKTKLLDAIGSRLGMETIVRNFIAVLIQHQRIAMLREIVEQFETEMDSRLGIAEAEVTSARTLGPEERQAIESQVSRLTGKQVRATYVTDSAILGGAVVRVGSTVYDGSVLGQIEKLKEVLINE